MKHFFLFFICGFYLMEIQAQTTTLTLGPTDDSYVSSQYTTATAGTATSADIGVTSGPYHTRAFIKFDLSGIPAGAVISSAKLNLTPNGSEGGDVTFSSFILESVAESWDESAINYTSADDLDISTINSVSITSIVSGKRVFDLKNLVKAIVANQAVNYGWRIRRNNETTVTAGSSYYTKESSTSGNRPTLVVNYYLPFQISAATITHATSLTNTDGQIVPTIIHGSGGTTTYQWYSSNGTPLATTQNLTNVGYGWYGLKISGAASHVVYHAFLVGVENEDVYIKFKVDPEYSEEAMIYNRNTGGIDYSNANFDNYHSYLASDWGSTGDWYYAKFLVKFNLWVDPALTVNQSDLYMTGRDHYKVGRTNTAEFRKITASWAEKDVTYNNVPATTGSIMEALSATSTTTENKVVDLNDFWNDWKTSNTANYGMLFQLDLYNNVRTRQQYYSSNEADTSKRPVIRFIVGLDYTENLSTLGYYELKDEFDGGYAKTHEGILKINFTEEYKIADNKYLPLKIYDASHELKGTVDLDGNITEAGTPVLEYRFDDNRHLVNLTGLSLVDDKIYILEVTTSTGEEKFLKFLYKD